MEVVFIHRHHVLHIHCWAYAKMWVRFLDPPDWHHHVLPTKNSEACSGASVQHVTSVIILIFILEAVYTSILQHVDGARRTFAAGIHSPHQY